MTNKLNHPLEESVNKPNKREPKSWLRYLLGLFVLGVFLTSYWFWLDYKLFLKTKIDFASKSGFDSATLTVKQGMGINQLANLLSQRQFISKPFYLRVFCRLNPKYAQIKQGEYHVKDGMNPVELLSLLVEGNVVQYPFAIIEGQTSFAIFESLRNQLDLSQREAITEENIIEKFLPEYSSTEGWLYPETYFYSKGASALKIVERSIIKMKENLKTEWINREPNLPYQSEYDALIMASIIEKETGIASERAEISGVFVRRLRKKMRLQTDPTVIYGIGRNFNGDITRKDLRTPTAYNTYTIEGLPPTPIAAPSLASIKAALHPKEGTALYFVADGSGGHYFSDTLKEHQAATRRMLKINR